MWWFGKRCVFHPAPARHLTVPGFRSGTGVPIHRVDHSDRATLNPNV